MNFASSMSAKQAKEVILACRPEPDGEDMTACSRHPLWPAGPHGAGSAGITLFETLLVLVLIGILATVTIPSLATSSGSHAVIEETRRVHSALVEARSRAIAEQRDYRFRLGSSQYQIEFWDGTGWAAHGAPHDVPESMTAAIGGSAAGSLVFEPDGRVDLPTSIVVENADHEHTIQVLASGLVRWEGRSQ